MKILTIFLSLLFFSLGATDVTFFVAADPHYGYEQWNNNEKLNKEAIKDMNALPGTTYPRDGVVQKPFGVIVPGDLTGNGHWTNWSGYWAGSWVHGFDEDYQVKGKGRLKFPVYEGYGNHDIHTKGNDAVIKGIKERNKNRSRPINLSSNGLHYSFDVDGVHFVNTNLYPGSTKDSRDSLAFLKEDLEKRVGKSGRPIVLYHHYNFNTEARWWTTEEKEAFYQVIKDYHVIAIFVGHSHATQFMRFHGIPVFNAPTVKEKLNYLVVHIGDDSIQVVERVNKKWSREWNVPYTNPHK